MIYKEFPARIIPVKWGVAANNKSAWTAGTITCNYDGFEKHKTVVEDNVFIGSDTMLVAPIKIGKGATTEAGSTISKDVPEGALAIGRAKQTIIKDWKRKHKEVKGK